jgi:hypothetical protein
VSDAARAVFQAQAGATTPSHSAAAMLERARDDGRFAVLVARAAA